MLKMNEKEKIEYIFESQPFTNILSIVKVKSLIGEGAISGDSFQVTSNNDRKFKLRLCSSIKQAKRIEKNVNLLPDSFPKFYGRRGKFVLFEWINGKSIYDLGKSIPPNLSYLMGKLIGEAHSLNKISNKNPDTFILGLVERIKKYEALNKTYLKKIMKCYDLLRKKVKLQRVLEFHDLNPRNFMYKGRKDSKNCKLYFVDEDGIGYKIKGIGLAKPLLIEKIIKTEAQKKAFWKGYGEFSQSNYFNHDYQNFLILVQLVRSIAAQSNNERNILKLKKKLDVFLAKL
jgi:hypothetical protein